MNYTHESNRALIPAVHEQLSNECEAGDSPLEVAGCGGSGRECHGSRQAALSDAVRSQPSVARCRGEAGNRPLLAPGKENGVDARRGKAADVRTKHIGRTGECRSADRGPEWRHSRSTPALHGVLHVLSLAATIAQEISRQVSECRG